MSSSEVKWEAVVSRTVETNAIPVLEKLQKVSTLQFFCCCFPTLLDSDFKHGVFKESIYSFTISFVFTKCGYAAHLTEETEGAATSEKGTDTSEWYSNCWNNSVLP